MGSMERLAPLPRMLFLLPDRIGCRGIFIRRFSDHLEKRPYFRPQRTMARMDHIEASPQGFRIEKFHGGELMGAELSSHCHLGQEGKT